MGQGVLYGVGVGPGDPELMTVKAVETIRRCPVLAAPRTRGGGMVALDIVKGLVDVDAKTIVPLDFAMSRDPAERAASHRAAADTLLPLLKSGQDVAMVNLGDVSIYGSFRYVADLLTPEGFEVVMIPGVTSFSAAAATLGVSLTEIDAPLHIIPDAAGIPDSVIAGDDACVCMKSGRRLPALLEELRYQHLTDRSILVQNCGMANEKIYRDLNNAAVDADYFSLVIVQARRGRGA
ncbi:MAG: precorrin-2 C(20)-methyltransferase [Planctomycetaceae bacterium]|nr:precorrin-2 C(20)-methyltransferase [Planctomycetaceae bacterium]